MDMTKLKPLVWEETESAHGEPKLVAYTSFGCYEIIGTHVWFNNRLVGESDEPRQLADLDYRQRVAGLFDGNGE